QVKEDVLTRKGELGIKVEGGQLMFQPTLLSKNQFLQQEEMVSFIDFENKPYSVALEKGCLAFTICQVLMIYKLADKNQIEVKYRNNKIETIPALILSHELSQKIFDRTGEIMQVTVAITI
ncbi:MAG: hypothetical protein JHC39_00165, partial [Lentimicrobium sp.]|nr:hypothetical protein [Lentimicrobium sp.]